ncbi:hypothetical protein Nepgr_015034 [Nepenthes gracilis]|uniref:Glabrous enhancer-binding protein-like DBD domain-containing protein n=1 Tax=Nepenthes gracilis TaxID=150966 RepID=A0AAD3SL39_NEPGR|nr:hypothetical protein Nepgr_015034 [Nepenthes gracilis]
MASEEGHAVYNDVDVDDGGDNEPLNDVVLDVDEDDVVGDENDDPDSDTDNGDTYSVCSAIPIATAVHSSAVTLAIPAHVHNGASSAVAAATALTEAKITSPEAKRQRVDDLGSANRPMPPIDDSRKLFQRLWTDEDEIELLRGFLDYTTQRGVTSSGHHHDTTAFYDQIKSKLQLDFNKNQLVEKLRRLKKKYRNVVNRISSGKEFVFKSVHDQATFEISRKIWSSSWKLNRQEFDDDDQNRNLNYSNSIPNSNVNNNSEPKAVIIETNLNTPKSRKRSSAEIEDNSPNPDQKAANFGVSEGANVPNSMQWLIEETVRSCLSPLLKELINNAVSGPVFGAAAVGKGIGRFALNAIPLNFTCVNSSVRGEVVDEKWRKQQILELEVFSKRLELVQDQIKSTLEELRSMGGG